MLKKFLLFLCLAAGIGLLTGCGKEAASSSASSASNQIPVTVSFQGMKLIAEAVGGDKISVDTVIPDGTEPHDFELKGDDIKHIAEARVFIYNGLGMEPWAQKAVQAAGNSNLIVVEASKDVNPIMNEDAQEVKEHGAYDPHAWLSVKSADTEAAHIRDALIQADPQNKEYFQQRYETFHNQLNALYKEYAPQFQAAPRKDVVTGHAAFAYLCRDFGLRQESVEDAFASGEPSAQKLAELVEYCKKNDVKTIYSESMVSPAVSHTLGDETGARVQVLYTMEDSGDG
ncbi:MAG TPA: ABC transporter substrate-binding protein, partial [Veillonellaceae bacterium]|nr:ABC transporter substrate-binding protein [Veillonellaceae bacterium]